jgi:hypothetical protein
VDRTALIGLAAVLALCPVVAGAQPAAPAAAGGGPVIAHATDATPRFRFLGGPSNSDIAWSMNGEEVVQKVGLEDPAGQIGAAVAAAIAKRKSGRVVEVGPGLTQRPDFTVTVATTDWSAGFFRPAVRPTYSVDYAAELRVSDASGKVVKTATCHISPDEEVSAGDNDEFLRHNGRLLKSWVSKAAENCQGTFVQKTKDL